MVIKLLGGFFMNVGFIGTGSMGSILIESFIQSGALKPQDITASNRTKSKADRLAEAYPGLQTSTSNTEVVLRSELIFLCIKPLEFKNVVDEISKAVTSKQIIVSITSPVLIELLQEHLSCKIAKVIPSITNFECSGASLCMYGSRMTSEDQILVKNLLSYISTPIVIAEEYTRVTSDISSCGPAFISFFLQKFIDAAVAETGIPRSEATGLASEMLLGTGKLITSGGFTPDSLQQRVSVPGGITAEALKMMEREMHGLFNQLIRTTHAKYDEDLEKVESLFYGIPSD
jgi:competence protein ComER